MEQQLDAEGLVTAQGCHKELLTGSLLWDFVDFLGHAAAIFGPVGRNTGDWHEKGRVVRPELKDQLGCRHSAAVSYDAIEGEWKCRW